jgi:glycine/D-amino acid oxidase-like deaminating enzyme
MLELWRKFFPEVEPVKVEIVCNGITTDTTTGEPFMEVLGGGKVGLLGGCNGYGAKAGDEVGRLMAEKIML